MKIAVDAMGGDYAPGVVMQAIAELLQEKDKDNIDLLLVGHQDKLSYYMEKYNLQPSSRLELVHKAAENVSKALYDPEVKKLNKEYNTAVDKALKDLEPKLKKMGANAIKGFQSGMKSQTKNLGSDVERIASSVVKQFKKTLKIKSPSRVTKSIGKFVTLGLSDGIKSETNRVVGTVRQLTNSLISEAENINIGTVKSNLSSLVNRNNGTNANYIGNSGNGVVNYTFNQTNNSPKALSRMEIYNQTRNQLNFARMVMNNA